MIVSVAMATTLASLLASSRSTGILGQRSTTTTTIRWLASCSSTNAVDANNDDFFYVKQDETTFATLAKSRKTLRRLGPMVTLATTTGTSSQTAADIGCDHGLLTYGLAATGHFETVVGVDVSQAALEQGALALLRQHQQWEAQNKDDDEGLTNEDNTTSTSTTTTRINFLLGSGLEPLVSQDGDTSLTDSIDTICVAGMGVHTMIDILKPQQLESIECQRIVVQPTNSRPRHMMLLYQHLFRQNFRVERETMAFLSSRWYLSTLFVRKKTTGDEVEISNELVLPGQTLESPSSYYDDDSSNSADQKEQHRLYQTYVDHHVKWLKRDQEQRGEPPSDEQDRHWLEAILRRRRKQ